MKPFSNIAPGPLAKFFLKTVGFLLIGNLTLRLVFLVFNFQTWDTPALIPVFKALLVGVRFDLSALFWFNGWWLLFFLIPNPWLRNLKSWRVAAWLSLVVNLPVWILNGTDIIYYGYSRKRLSHELITLGTEIGNFHLIDAFPWLWVLIPIFCITWLTWRWIKNAGEKAHSEWLLLEKFPWKKLAAVPVYAGLMILAIRGGWQTTPLRPAMAFSTQDFFLGNLGNNSAFNVLHAALSVKEKPISRMDAAKANEIVRKLIQNDFDSDFQAPEFPVLRRAEFAGDENRYNVVLLILESMNAEFLGCLNANRKESLTPFLDSLAGTGRFWTNFYSNGTRSVESLPAILNSIPEIFLRPTIGSPQETNLHCGIGNLLSARNYHTSFFCGGKTGTMGFDSYSRISGISHYYGQEDFPGNQKGIQSKWGLHDLPFIEWMADRQNQFQEPFFSVWFSISNHFPFEIPPDCPDYIRQKNISQNEKTVMYTDYALSRYFQKISGEPWFSRTVFAITADHCFFEPGSGNRKMMASFHVPFILTGPAIEPGKDERIGSHLSILPTLIEILKLDSWHAAADVSLMSKSKTPFSISNMIGVITLAQNGYSFSSNFENNQPCYQLENGEWENWVDAMKTEEGKKMNEILNAYYQVFHNIRISNSMIGPQYDLNPKN